MACALAGSTIQNFVSEPATAMLCRKSPGACPPKNLHLDFGYTDATGKTDPQYFPEFGAPASFSYDFRNGAPQVTMLPNGNGTTVDWTNPNSFVFDFANNDVFLNKDKEAYLYLDAEQKLDLGVLKSVKFGFKASNHERDASGDFTTYGDFFRPINTIPASAGSRSGCTSYPGRCCGSSSWQDDGMNRKKLQSRTFRCSAT
jgi:hypothetical protein